MSITHAQNASDAALVALFEAAFTASEGAEEGATIAAFVTRLLGGTATDDLRVFIAWGGARPVGAAMFSRLTYPQDPRRVMILSPMAVIPGHQGRGIGQALISEALGVLRLQAVDIAITYGDPNFYVKVGFHALTAAQAAAPHPLSQPQGWIGQALSVDRFPPLDGPCQTVPALDDPALW